jgi:hypothetical protein
LKNLVKLPILKEVREMVEDTEKDEGAENVIDPPVHDGGGDKPVSVDAGGEAEKAIDPPVHDGGT